MNTWISQTGIPDIKELREFSKIIRNSGITVKQCAQSFRFIQILHKFGINDEIDLKYIESTKPTAQRENKSDFVKENNNKTGGIKKDYSSNPRNNFYYFIEDLYNYCKNKNIDSSSIIEWIQDLIDLISFLENNKDNNTTGFDGNTNETGGLQNHSINTSERKLYEKYKNIKDEKQIQIPLISEINEYIEQEKIKSQYLSIKNNKLKQEIKDLEEQKNILISKITNLKGKESVSLTYLD